MSPFRWKGYRCQLLTAFIVAFAFAYGVVRVNLDSRSRPINSAVLESYNLMDSFDDVKLDECNIDYANAHRLQQDHPCVINLIRRHYLHSPSPRNVPYDLNNPDVIDPSSQQAASILRHLQNKTSGFFVECGALNGELLSNTLYMERFRNWSGILIEPIRDSFLELMTVRRKAFALPVCLSLQPYPTKVLFKDAFAWSSILAEKDASTAHRDRGNGKTDVTAAQCFPLYSILLAVNRTLIDYFSLDVEGHELQILKTIPWHKVKIQTLSVEWEHVPEGKEALVDYMAIHGYYVFDHAEIMGHDYLFARDFPT